MMEIEMDHYQRALNRGIGETEACAKNYRDLGRGFGPLSSGSDPAEFAKRAALNLAGDAQRTLSPTESAERLLKADAEHRSLAADQVLMLHMTMPFVSVGLNKLASGIFQWCKHQGFWDKDWIQGCPFPSGEATRLKKAEKIALIHSEVSEMLEAIRKGDTANEAEEAADVAIRLLDYCGACGIDLGCAIEAKMLKNYQRPFKHGKEF